LTNVPSAVGLVGAELALDAVDQHDVVAVEERRRDHAGVVLQQRARHRRALVLDPGISKFDVRRVALKSRGCRC
jgi:hypothetical protein